MSSYSPKLNAVAIAVSAVSLVVALLPYPGKNWGLTLIPVGMCVFALMLAIKGRRAAPKKGSESRGANE